MARASRFAPLLLAFVLIAFLIERHRVGMRFPIPWPDEGSFLWQALAFRDGFSLFAPEVNPEREAMWMPPMFMVLEGLIFKVVPFSLDASRTLSALFVCGAVVCVQASLRRELARFVFPLLAGLFLFCPIARMAGNVARMEGLELFLLAGAFLLMERGRLAALAVLAVSPLAHPNGLFGIAIGVPYYLARFRLGARPRRLDLVLIGVAVLAWAGYGAHVSLHWEAFLRDMDAQLRFKQLVSAGDGGFKARVMEPVLWSSALALTAGTLAQLRRKEPTTAMAAFGAALLVQTLTAAGWLYEVYPAFALLLGSAVAFDGLSPAVVETRGTQRSVAAAFLLGLLVLDALAFHENAFLERSLERSVVRRRSLKPAYLTDEDRDMMTRYLTSIVPKVGEPALSVQFFPDAEALVYEKLRGPRFRYVQQTFYEHHYDVLVVHDSIWSPPFVRNLELLKLLYGKGQSYDESVIRRRDGMESWTVYRWPVAPSG